MLGTLEALFLLTIVCYDMGSFKIKGVHLGRSGVLLAVLYFGYLGYQIPSVVRDLSLALFVGAVGLTAGPRFFRNLKQNAMSYGALALVIMNQHAITLTLFSKASPLQGDIAY